MQETVSLPSRVKAVDTSSRRWYHLLYVQVLIGISLAILFGLLQPSWATEMKPLGDIFIKLIKMSIGLVIFCTIVMGIGSMDSLARVGRVGGKALLYFEVVTTIALAIGLCVAQLVKPGQGFNADPTKMDNAAVAGYASKAHNMGFVDFVSNIVPNTIVDAFIRSDTLPIVFVSILIGVSLARVGEPGRPIREFLAGANELVFNLIGLLMRLAPIGAFGAMAYTIGQFGFGSLRPLATLVGVFYLTAALFVVVILGSISAFVGCNLAKLLKYFKSEILIVLGTCSSDSVLPSIMDKLERLGCSKPLVGLVVPTGYVFNSDGTSIYITLTALFVAQATNTDLTLSQEIAILLVALVTSKGVGGFAGSGFVGLVATLSIVPTVPLAGIALVLGVDRFLGEVRAIVNLIGNIVGTLAIAAWEGELDTARLTSELNSY